MGRTLRQKKLAVFLAAALAAVLGLVVYFSLTQKHNEWFYADVLREPVPVPALLLRSAPELIAHAGGTIDGVSYTNSREALLSAVDQGFRLIEVDLRKTLDGHYFGVHRYREFRRLTGQRFFYLPPTSRAVRESKILGHYTPLMLTDIAGILKDHPGVFLVTDKARDYETLLKEFPYPEQLIVEVSTLVQYIAARRAGVRYPALSTHDYALCKKYGIPLLTMSRQAACESRAQAYLEEGGTLMAAYFKKSSDIPPVLRRRGVLVYVDEKD